MAPGHLAACDVADRDALAALLDSIPEHQPLTAVLHAASALPVPTPLSESTVDDFAQACRARLYGARHLDEPTAGHELDAFVAVLLRRLHLGQRPASRLRRGQRLPRRAGAPPPVRPSRRDFGLLGCLGCDTMAAEGDLSRYGMEPMQPRLALSALRQAVDEGQPHLVVAAIDWDRFVPADTMARPRPLLRGVPAAVAALAEAESAVTRRRGGGAGEPAGHAQRGRPAT